MKFSTCTKLMLLLTMHACIPPKSCLSMSQASQEGMPGISEQQGMPIAQQSVSTETMPGIGRQQAEQPFIQPSDQQLQVVTQQELDQIQTGMKKIDGLKQELKKLLASMDKKLDDAQKDIADAKKMSFDILKKETEKEALILFDKISEISNKIKESENFAQREFNTNFSHKMADIKVETAKIESIIPIIKTKIAQFEMSQATPSPSTSQQGVQTSPAAPEKEEIASRSKPPQEERSVLSSIYNAISSVTAIIAKTIKDLISWLTEPSLGEVKKNTTEEVKKKRDTPTEPITTSMQTPSSTQGALPTLAPMTQTSVQGIITPESELNRLKTEAKANIIILDQQSSQLDQLRLNFDQQYQTIKQSIRSLQDHLNTIPVIKKQLEKTQPKQKKLKEPRWKKMTMHVISKFLDLLALMITATIDLCRSTYNYLLAPSVHTFVYDVKTKIKQLEDNDARKAAAKRKQQLSISPQTTNSTAAMPMQ